MSRENIEIEKEKQEKCLLLDKNAGSIDEKIVFG